MKNFLLLFCALAALTCCRQDPQTLFSRLSASQTGIAFNNTLKEDDPQLSILNYPYFYNGGGVAIGDLNNDSLADIIFTGNMVKSAVYLNKGDLKFADITKQTTVGEQGGWCTGVTMADVNGDGWLDIYICRSGLPDIAARRNLLFINNHNLTFTESAARYGLDDPGYSTQASFFDYDKDGDLDLILINQSDPKYSRGDLDYIQTRMQPADSTLANKLFRNDGGHFTNVSKLAGLQSTVFTYSLGVSTADVNGDGWPDIYVTNDFEEPDYMYINHRDGTFSDELAQRIDHTSLFSMGVDIADYNNDLLPDVVVLDMLPEGNHAQKMHIANDNYARYNYQFRKGMPFQFMRNTLQKNNGDGTFSEVAQLAGVSNTDWSWSPLLADLDNDGRKDLFITNGYKRDNTDMQFMGYAMDQSIRIQKGDKAATVQEYISHMPGISLPNYVFKNDGNDHFVNKIREWGFDQNTFSHGAAYADLDNDGDIDLVTNDTDGSAGVYRNNTDQVLKNNFIRMKFIGNVGNRFGIGAKVFAYAGGDHYYAEQNPVRGFQSSVDYVLLLGLGSHASIDSLRVVWPDQSTQVMKQVPSNRTMTLAIANARQKYNYPGQATPMMEETSAIDFIHTENYENDFTKQFLLPHFFSHNGPCMAHGDINGDGLADIFAGGAKGQAGVLFLQTKDHSFLKIAAPALEADAASEDTDAAFFDADGDGDLDLYVVSGGYEFVEDSPLLQDRLYLNDGKGQFRKSAGRLQEYHGNKTCVRPQDIDNDGDIDLFVGGGVVPGRYPLASPSKIYFNDGKGNFSTLKPANAALGIVNDAVWVDLDHDGKKDLIAAGEWMSLKVYLTHGALFTDASKQWFPFASSGWWNCVAAADFDGDGDVDLIAGNYGLNSQLRADDQHPIEMYYPDIDGNGSLDPVIMRYIDNESVPLVFRDDLIGQVPALRRKFTDFTSFAKAGIHDILDDGQFANAPVLRATDMTTAYFENTGTGFEKRELPIEAQIAPVFAIAVTDVNHDGHPDVILAGNNQYNRIYLGRYDANHGIVLLGDGAGHFKYLPQAESGLKVRGDVRSLIVDGDQVLFGVNNAAIKSYRIKPRIIP